MYRDPIKSNKDLIKIQIVLLTLNTPLLQYNVRCQTELFPPTEVHTNQNGASVIIQTMKLTVAAG